MATVTSLHDSDTTQALRQMHSGRKPLRILLSAYACEPNRGSEPGIGWQWATRLAERGHEVVVLTRANNAEAIVAALGARQLPTLHFEFFDLPRWASFWKRGGHGVHLYYLLWQWASFPVAYRLHRKWRFDVVHHLTFGVFRHPSSLALLHAPFVFGPVGGGEQAPKPLRRALPFAGRCREFVRDLANAFAGIDPLLRFVLRRSAVILCKTQETLNCLPRSLHAKSRLFLEIGVDAHDSFSDVTIGTRRHSPSALRVLFVGRLVYLKGLHIALPAIAHLLKSFPESRFTIVGDGEMKRALQRSAAELRIEHCIDWVPWMAHDEVLREYRKHDVFLFPGLHDSSGNAVLEAMTNGLPVVCLNCGGPARIVDDVSGIRIGSEHPTLVAQRLGDALVLLAGNTGLRTFFARGAYERANNYFSWPAQIDRMTALYQGLLAPQHARVTP